MRFRNPEQQHDYILDYLENVNNCVISDKHMEDIGDIVSVRVNDILKENYNNGADMKAVMCIFDTLLLSSTNVRKKKSLGLYDLNSSINAWIDNMKKLDVSSEEGFVYKTKVLGDIDVIIKVPQRREGVESMLREYYIGLELNKLRYITPVFVYTLGAFLCSAPTRAKKICERPRISEVNKSTYVIYENVEGRSVSDLLRNDLIDDNDFMEIFIQLLYGLELAQRECKFTHFDLHPGNVMVKQGPFDSYSFVLDNKIITVKNPKYIPVIIDFGMSSATVGDITVGSNDFPEYGMLPFMVQGYDAYKFLNNSVVSANPETRKVLTKIYNFYRGDRDPYKIWVRGTAGIREARDEYCAQASFSGIAHYTPLMLINDILGSTLGTNLKSMFTETTRDKFALVRYDSMIKQYEYIFDHKKTGIEKAVIEATACISNKTPSYISGLYNVKILNNYNDTLDNNPSLDKKISLITSGLNLQKDRLIEVDLLRLNKVFDIEVPSETEINDTLDTIFSIKIKDNSLNKAKTSVVSRIKYHHQVKPYLDMYYTILEVGLTSEFDVWIKSFLRSPVYKTYINNHVKVTAALRWVDTLDVISKSR